MNSNHLNIPNAITADYHPLLNRATLQKLKQDGLGDLINSLADIAAARRFALWCNESGARVNLYSILIAASRQTARYHLCSLGLIIGPDLIGLDGEKKILPGLDHICLTYLQNYPRTDHQKAWRQQAEHIRAQLMGEMFVLDAVNDNPALSTFHHLFDDSELINEVEYTALLKKIDTYLGSKLPEPTARKSLVDLLREPARAAPDSLSDQIAYIKQHWSRWLPAQLLQQLEVARAIYDEENRPRGPGPGAPLMPVFGQGNDSDTPAAFTDDTDWMTGTVMLAKSIYVWLDQLSSRYQREIARLADIPEEELARLSSQGFNALWLIGIWERSHASRKIKQLCGNPEAEASAYALHAYRVASDLGGDQALAELERRCKKHNIRLACDVVPNHTGIDSEWLHQHPDWFIQTDQPPYPAYRFTGPDLSEDHGVSIRIEDGYWDHSDAAVVCEYHDHETGRRRYIYHGNDGTHMPWNDTAQLNFLLPEVRQAMSDLIVAVAQRFRLIRFDAAMTLARKHYRRLWFPPPGGSAGVPSRSQAWMTDEEFDQTFPVEFWREVVDRINLEAPGTLLIAEAFWLMESYFVRTLGMHRVYNSAFMNMLKQEENTKYRKILKDILVYNPEILKRYVNFMNNPDEATAVEQFGKGDKYFGVATLLATLPGLPMFGHGQVEGYREKYGMEYRRAYWAEQPDEGFIAHHERQIFPLLQRRPDFAGVEDFSLFDFSTDTGVDENVYAYTNGPAGKKSLVVFNNSPQATRGRIHRAAPKAIAEKEGIAQDMPPLYQELDIDPSAGRFYCYRNLQGEELLRPVEDVTAGFELHLEGYEHQVLSEFHTLSDEDNVWQQVFKHLQGRPTRNLEREKQAILYHEAWEAFVKLFELERLHILAGTLSADPPPAPAPDLLTDLNNDFDKMIKVLRPERDDTNEKGQTTEHFAQLKLFPAWLTRLSSKDLPLQLLPEMWYGRRGSPGLGVTIIAWLLLHELGGKLGLANDRDCWSFLQEIGLDYVWKTRAEGEQQQRQVFLALLLLKSPVMNPATDDEAFTELCTDSANSDLLGINRNAGTIWFNREGMTAMAGAVALQAATLQMTTAEPVPEIEKIAEKLRQRLSRATAVGYRLDKFLLLG